MTLRVIGSGFGRTGTMSTKLALEQLGYGPCHHMTEVMADPDQPAHWAAYAAGEPVDWHAAFERYAAQVDFPGAAVWPDLAAAFPEAKIVHTERPEEDWWPSYAATIHKFFRHRETMDLPPPVADIFRTMDTILVDGVLGGTGKEQAIAAYRRNNERVREEVPAERLLIFSPASGWEPLCGFLGVPVPAAPFPRTNGRDEFWTIFGSEPED